MPATGSASGANRSPARALTARASGGPASQVNRSTARASTARAGHGSASRVNLSARRAPKARARHGSAFMASRRATPLACGVRAQVTPECTAKPSARRVGAGTSAIWQAARRCTWTARRRSRRCRSWAAPTSPSASRRWKRLNREL